MDNLESLKKKIQVIGDVHSIVKTMKSLAAVSMRQHERALDGLTAYRSAVLAGFEMLLRVHPLAAVRREPVAGAKLGAIVIGSDQGLCGQFNERLAEHVAGVLGRHEGGLLVAGRRAVAPLEEAGYRIERALPLPGSTAGAGPLVQELLIQVEQWQSRGQLERIVLFHNRPLAAGAFDPCCVPLVPAEWPPLRPARARARREPVVTMDPVELLSALLREQLYVTIYGALLQSLCSENASRFVAMQSAEKNVEEASRELAGRFQRLRQGAVTAELLDIIAGFEALGGAESLAGART